MWQCITGAFLALGAVIMLVMAGSMGRMAALGMGLAFGLGLFAALYFFTGRGLMNYRNWARIVMAVLIALSILQNLAGMAAGGNPGQFAGAGVGMAWQIAILIALFGGDASKIFSDRYQQEIRGDRRPVPWASSIFFWLPLVLIGGVFLLAFVAVAALR